MSCRSMPRALPGSKVHNRAATETETTANMSDRGVGGDIANGLMPLQ